MVLEHNNWYHSSITVDKWYQMIWIEVMLIKIGAREDKYNQDGDQLIRWKEQFLLMTSEDGGRAHPTIVDRRSLI